MQCVLEVTRACVCVCVYVSPGPAESSRGGEREGRGGWEAHCYREEKRGTQAAEGGMCVSVCVCVRRVWYVFNSFHCVVIVFNDQNYYMCVVQNVVHYFYKLVNVFID